MNLKSMIGKPLRKIFPPAPVPKPTQPKAPVVRPDKWIEKYQVKTFIDVGAHNGEFIDWWLERFADLDIYAFEPLPDLARELEKKYASNNRIKVFPVALGAESAETTLHVSSYAPSSSLLPMGELHKSEFPHTAGSVQKKIRVESLDEVLRNVELKDDLLIKIDTQGFEDQVIKGGRETIKKAKLILIEVSFAHLYVGQSLFHEIYSMLHEMDFEFAGMRNQILSPTDKSVLQAHAWFRKKNS